MPSQRLKQYLDENCIKYVTINHSLAFTAIDIAKSAHIPTKIMAKTVILNIEDKLAMLVLPAAYRIDLELIKQAFSSKNIELASEQVFSRAFPDCEVGAMPPFGNLYEMEIFVTESITEQDEVAFNAGSHSEIVKMRYRDYERLVAPKFILLSV